VELPSRLRNVKRGWWLLAVILLVSLFYILAGETLRPA
jgi:hypothetical protein